MEFWQTHSSDLLRASRTAEIILEGHERQELRTSPLLREFSLGVLEDLPRGTSRCVALRDTTTHGYRASRERAATDDSPLLRCAHQPGETQSLALVDV